MCLNLNLVYGSLLHSTGAWWRLYITAWFQRLVSGFFFLVRDQCQKFPHTRNYYLCKLWPFWFCWERTNSPPVNWSLNWQHGLCKSPSPNPLIKTLYVDHPCGQPNCARVPSPANNPLLGIKQGAVKMLSLSMELVFLILQFLDGEKFKEISLHR